MLRHLSSVKALKAVRLTAFNAFIDDKAASLMTFLFQFDSDWMIQTVEQSCMDNGKIQVMWLIQWQSIW